MNYTTVLHPLKLALGLTDPQYIVADLIYRMCTNPSAPDFGFCTMDKDRMAEQLGYKKRSLSRHLSTLRRLEYVWSSPCGKKLRTTKEYSDIRYKYEAAKSRIFLQSNTPYRRIQSANVAHDTRHNGEYIYTKKILISLFKDLDKIFEQVESDFFSEKNLVDWAAIREKFILAVCEGKYGDPRNMSESLVALKYKGWVIGWLDNVNAGVASAADAGSSSDEADYSDLNYYNNQ